MVQPATLAADGVVQVGVGVGVGVGLGLLCMGGLLETSPYLGFVCAAMAPLHHCTIAPFAHHRIRARLPHLPACPSAPSVDSPLDASPDG